MNWHFPEDSSFVLLYIKKHHIIGQPDSWLHGQHPAMSISFYYHDYNSYNLHQNLFFVYVRYWIRRTFMKIWSICIQRRNSLGNRFRPTSTCNRSSITTPNQNPIRLQHLVIKHGWGSATGQQVEMCMNMREQVERFVLIRAHGTP